MNLISSSIKILVFLLLSSQTIFGQKSLVDSILKIYPDQTGVERLKSRNNIAFFYFVYNTDSSLHYVNESLKESRILKNDSVYIRALTIKGIVMDRMGEKDSARFYHKESIRICKILGHYEEQGPAMNNIGLVEWKDGNLNEALSYFFKSLEIDENCNDLEGMSIALSNIGLIYMEMDQYHKSKSYLHQSLKIKEENNYMRDKGKVYSNLGICCRQLEQVDSAKYYYNHALATLEEQHDLYGIAKVKNGLSAVAFQEDNYELALKYTLEALAINDSLGDIQLITNHLNLCAIYFALGKHKTGIENGNIAQEYVDLGYSVEKARRIYIFRALNYAALGDRGNALVELDKYEDAVKSRFSEENAQAISELEIKYETEKKERLLLAEMNKTAEQKAALTASELKISNRNVWLISILAFTLFVVFISIFSIQRNKRKAQAEKELLIEQEKQKKVELMISMQENERKRISKDLHDGVGQQLSGLKMAWDTLIEEIDPAKTTTIKKIQDLSKELHKSTEGIRSISHVMMPKTLQDLGLVPALENLLEKTFSFIPTNYTFEQHNATERFNENIEICFYRITQELLNNCIKHANASLVTVQLVKSKNYLTLLVEDDGVGMSGQASEGHGMANIETRITSIGGEVHYETSPEGGTLATVRVAI